MKVFIDKNNQNKEVTFEGTALQLLDKLNINSEEVIFVQNDEVVTLDTKLANTDSVKILSVISGG